MIDVSRALPVNPPDLEAGEPRLTREDIWRGLEMKANNALPFVAAMTYCQVVARHGDLEFEREIEFRGERSRERITLEPMERVTFDRSEARVSGVITNDIEEDADGELWLRFSYRLSIEGIAPDSPEEHEYAQSMEGDYLQAVKSTIAAVRRVVKGEGLPA